MNIESDAPGDQAFAQLRQLPAWQPPSHVAARLAAAAARQAAQSPVPAVPTFEWLRRRLLYRLPLALGAGVLALALVVGVIVGTYSSIAIASPIVLWWRKIRQSPLQRHKKASPGGARV